ncbi:MAG: Holliday junction branch migration protein RuvA [Flavobacteriales bacterium]|jgi:Holliday junction DNA helicase RuvA|nr:Holliday junction branch migration protein RuvA [Flavobacteriales bacterium]MBT6699970.1 Holliday junction branch migration protein RuvA [Flavobacteriales bacterium]MBT6814984.1 Holliday junction branch migration protein RuvA [Flavobacteriales bacterium]MBT7619856.1 Holliday junction branch migration protein RuvA [Flavobacteriales bacterium]MBT7726156.1 Holliday junction branch migration protein RuvA [Flavobacteriales bacterium]
MISHINGKLVEKTPTYVVIDCNGVGYKLNISLQTYSSIQAENCKLLTHLAVKEDSHTLYGFYTSEERDLFRQLISVSGVGPSTARMILSTYSAEEIVNYIITADVAAIQNVKGIGGKTAQRIIIDLKDKVGKGKETSDLLFTQDNTIKEESLSALLALGFTKKVAYKKMEQVIKNHEGEITVEDLVRRSLG